MTVFKKLFLDDFYKKIEQNKKCKEIQECVSIKEILFVNELSEDLQADFYSYQEEIIKLLKTSQYEAFKIGLKAGLKKCSKVLFKNK